MLVPSFVDMDDVDVDDVDVDMDVYSDRFHTGQNRME